MVRLGNNEVVKTLTKTLTFVDANAAADAEGSTIALHERCSGELNRVCFVAVVVVSFFVMSLHNSTIKTVTKTPLFKCIENFTTKNENFHIKKKIFRISAQNIICGYSL